MMPKIVGKMAHVTYKQTSFDIKKPEISGDTRGGGRGADLPPHPHPRVTPSGGDTRMRFIFLWSNWQRKLDKHEGGEGGSGDETTAKGFQRTMTKKVVKFFCRKNRVTP